MKRISASEIEEMTRLYRINLINSISGYKSANLIGTLDEHCRTNLAVFSSVTHFGSNPPLLGLVTRPLSVPRHTYKNIKELRHYTINHVHKGIIAEAHHSSAKYAEDVSEFDKTGLEPWYSKQIKAPYVKGAAIQMGMEYVEEYHIKANNTVLLLGQIVELWLNDELLAEDGWVDLNKANTVSISGLDTYHLPQSLARYAYARPDQDTKEL